MNKNTNRYSKANSPSQRSLTPTMLIESPQFTLANYKLMLKKAKSKPKACQNSGLSSTLSLNKISSVTNSISSTDTCLFKQPARDEGQELENLRNQLDEMQNFARNALEAQKRYFEEVIWKLEEEIIADKEFFNQEIEILRQEIVKMRRKKEKQAVVENIKDNDYKTQYLKNKEFIGLLEKQNKLLIEKMQKK